MTNNFDMLGKRHGPRPLWIIAFAIGVVVATSCAHNVGQADHSGDDGKIKGAREMVLTNGQAKARGIVTYPGGDRVDWKFLTTPTQPAPKKGTLNFMLTWVPPRPGLRLKFDVFNEWGDLLLSSKHEGGSSKHSRSQEAKLEHVKGKYFVRIYAVNRGDAGTYKMQVDWAEDPPPIVFDADKLDVPEPPKLAAIPEPEGPDCDEFSFDQKNPKCRNICPKSGAPPGWPACAGKCPDPPSVDIPSCRSTMPCPDVPDKRVKACTPDKWPKCPDENNPDPKNPNCPATRPPKTGRVVEREQDGANTRITVLVAGLPETMDDMNGWTVVVIDATGKELGPVKLSSVGKGRAVGLVTVSPDKLQNAKVKFTPPAVR